MHRRLLSLATAAVTLAALVATAQTATAAVSPRASFTAFTVEGAVGAFPLASGFRQFTGDAAHVSVSSNAISFSSDVDAGYWIIGVSAASLDVGTYETSRAGGSPLASLDLSGESRGCNVASGTMVVHEIARDVGTGDISSFAATYSTSCEGTMPPNVGELRYNSTVDYERFGAVALGKDSTVHTVTVTAATATTFGTASVDGTDASAFRIDQDSCSGTTVAAGGTCTITLLAHPLEAGGHAAHLGLPSASGDRTVGLTVTGVETPEGTYTAMTPRRVLDTRKATGVTTTSPIGDGKYKDVQVTGKNGVPSAGVAAVVLNVTAISPTSRGYLTVYPAGQSRPTASSVNFGKGWVGANLVTVPIAAGGKVRFYNADGSTHVAADVVGYYHSAGSTAAPTSSALADYISLDPERLIDTRTDDWDRQPLDGQSWLWQAINFGDEYNARIKAFAVNITVVKPTKQGHLTAFDGNSANIPATSTLNFTAGRTVPNMAIIKTSPCGSDCGAGGAAAPRIGVYNASLGSAHVVVDLVGVYYKGEAGDRGWRFKSLASPKRFVDSRKGQGLPANLGSNKSAPVVTPGSIAGWNTMAVVTNTTAAQPSSTTVFTLWRNDGSARPTVSNLNPYAGQVVSNMTITEVWNNNDFRIHNLAGTAPVVIDAAGTMEYYPAVVAGDPFGGVARAQKGAAAERTTGSRLTPSSAAHGLGSAS
jgi:hypothetical protein